MTQQDFLKIIQKKAIELKFDPVIFAAICENESAWDPTAMRYEPDYKYLSTPEKYAALLHITVATETELSKFSYGLCQIMGACTRWLGFREVLPKLLDPEINLSWGAVLFHKQCDKYPDIKDKIASWNAGSPRKKSDGTYVNQAYVDKVYGTYLKMK